MMIVDLSLFGSNALKIPSGAWFPQVIGLGMFTLMSTWRTGRRLVLDRVEGETMPIADFLASSEASAEARISGIAVFLTTHREHVPPSLMLNLKHNKILHQTFLLVRVATDNVPRVPGPDRIKWRALGQGFWQIDAHFGFAQTPNISRELGRAQIPGSISCTERSPTLSGGPTSNRRLGREWRDGVSTFTLFSAGSRRALPSSFGSPPTRSSSCAPR